MNDKIIIDVEKIIFFGKKSLSWDDVRKYLSRYDGHVVKVKETGDSIMIGSHFAAEYCGSRYTNSLRGMLVKAKANASQVIVQLVENASNRRWVENKDNRHCNDAKGGWYRYDVYFSIPVEFSEKIATNIYKGTLIVRIHDKGMYLYDIINIKKEDSKPFESKDRT